MELISDKINEYIENNSSPEDAVLAKLNRETYLKVQMPQMLSGNIQGKFLEMISQMLQPKRILEIGTFTGYSGICLAKGLPKDGVLHTIDVNEELGELVSKYVAEASLESKIVLHHGNATQIIPTLNETFDLVFIDADKQNYCNYFDLVVDKVRSGGFIVADNVLWSGKVAEEKHDKDTAALHAYNQKVLNDSRVENFILPLRDGLNIARKL
ncbi:MAG: O-methyltransferase [Chitinophagales bacterium]|nr:O-methyltransferase [Chitinophagales bacterium]MCO5280121.1 O-methyltransferase [Chitinophagales bacterium]OJV27281.1 MAG: methyltransferase [Bacteroidetes bacterium 37-13]HRN95126.1 O-methyltransferase [Chitinophagales bacterium]HRP39741.1 O-methyltransferase [Chitinophagales bacterium]